MNADLDIAYRRASALIGSEERRSLGRIRADETIAFARACGEADERYLAADRPDFAVHPLYLPSLLRGADGARDDEYRPDGMFVDEVPGTAGLDVRLMAGGQSIEWHRPTPLDVQLDVCRRVEKVEWKGRDAGRFLLVTVLKTYRGAHAGTLAVVSEGFIVR